MELLDRKTYLMAQGLFHLGQRASKELDNYDKALHTLLGEKETGTHASDEMCCDGDLDTALEKMGYSTTEFIEIESS